jgi:hypothetical protein
MELKQVRQTFLRTIHRLTRSRTRGLIGVLFFASTLSLLIWNGRAGAPPTAAPSPTTARSPVATLAGSPEQGPSAGGDILPAERRLVPQVGRALIRYFQPQAAQPPHVSFVESAVDSTQLFWFRLRECESEGKCPYWPWWRKPDVNVIVVPDDFVVGIRQPNNICHGVLAIHPDSDYSLACREQRLRVVSAPTAWRGAGPLPRTEWLAPPWNPNAR